MDKRTSYLLKKINETCSEGSYKIVEEKELLECFPPKLQMDQAGLKHCIDYLKANRYIDIKYEEDGVYCLCPLPEGRGYFEFAKEAKTDNFQRRREMVFMTAIGAFVGAFLGSLIVGVILIFAL